ncbi:hypothetical protein QY048_11205 [Bradyrhizobium sp. WYCCWR 12677]|nr:hypothetical protein [Bradyrhizobium sp. WYCCWR 12677]MDN5001447.1 hypothetical protein [Bradyrhizobium sp. WYCCWR 12677]
MNNKSINNRVNQEVDRRPDQSARRLAMLDDKLDTTAPSAITLPFRSVG